VANRTATVETDKGTITFALHEDKAPVTTQNFVGLAERGFYNGLTFHRVEPGFVIQGGCPLGTGTGSSDQRIKLEIHPDLRHDRAGTVAMARSSDPNSASCQFYITLAPTPFLDDNYAVFGHVISGQDVASSIRKGDKIQSVTIS
jgi:peptidyl-prolyl cis-trans isomerase B (cyclophilin B)